MARFKTVIRDGKQIIEPFTPEEEAQADLEEQAWAQRRQERLEAEAYAQTPEGKLASMGLTKNDLAELLGVKAVTDALIEKGTLTKADIEAQAEAVKK